MNILIPSKSEDAEALFQSCWKILRPYQAEGIMGRMHREAFVESLRDGRLYLAKEGDELVGFMQVEQKTRLRCLAVTRIAVHPGHRGEGIGTQLLVLAKDRAQAQAAPLRLRVSKRNPRAIQFYTKLGFQVVEEKDSNFALEVNPASWGIPAASAPPVQDMPRPEMPRQRRRPHDDETLSSYTIPFHGEPLTVEAIKALTPAQREEAAEMLFAYFRARGFPYPAYAPLILDKDWQDLVALDPADAWVDTTHLSTGQNSGSKLSKQFFPHFYACTEVGARGQYKRSMLQAFEDDDTLREVIRNRLGITFTYKGEFFPFKISGDMLRQGFRSMHLAPTTTYFKASVARAIYARYLPDGGVTYDPSLGFGQRMLGYLADGRGRMYLGTDPWTRQAASAAELCTFLRRQGKKAHAPVDLYTIGSEVFCPGPWQGRVDLVFTSPPYYTTEIYDGGAPGQAYAHRTYEEFLSRYWVSTVSCCAALLRRGGRFVINIGRQFKEREIAQDMVSVIEKAGFNLEQELAMVLPRSHLSKKSGTGNNTKTEPIFVLSKR